MNVVAISLFLRTFSFFCATIAKKIGKTVTTFETFLYIFATDSDSPKGLRGIFDGIGRLQTLSSTHESRKFILCIYNSLYTN